MRYVGTSHYSPWHCVLASALLLGLPGCEGKIGKPETAPWMATSTRDEPAPAPGTAPAVEERGLTGSDPSLTTANGKQPTGDRPTARPNEAPGSMSASGPRFSCVRPELRGLNQLSLRRLTRDEYLDSLRVALGPEIMSAPAVREAALQIPEETTGDITREFQNAHGYEHAAAILKTSQAIAKSVVSDPATRKRVFGECAVQEADYECAERYLAHGALRITKRPLDTQRSNALLDAFSDAGEGNAGLELLLSRLLQAPETVFHLAVPRPLCDATAEATETDGPDCQRGPAPSGTGQADDWTVAARVSFALTGHAPDQELLDAAASGELRSVEQVRPHAERLVETADARKQLEAILDAWLKLRTLPTPDPAVAKHAGIDATGFSQEARRELLDYALYEILDREVDATTLMTDAVGFPRSEALAKVYGTTIVKPGDAPAALTNGHRGLLLRVAPLLSGQLRTSPILRGVYVRMRLLCDELLSPDFSIIQSRTADLLELDQQKLSSRQIAQRVTEPALCMGCHVQINPLGFALESYGPLGAHRTVELDYDLEGRERATLPLDTHVQQVNIDDSAARSLSGADELVQALATSSKYQACIAERFFSQAQLRKPSAGDLCTLSEIEAVLRDGGSVKEAWLASIVHADLFIRKAPESPL